MRLFSRKNNKATSKPTNTAPTTKKNGGTPTATDAACGAGVVIAFAPNVGSGVLIRVVSLLGGNVKELIAPAIKRANAMARIGASRIFVFSWSTTQL